MNDKEIKKWIREKASHEPEKFYPIKTLKELGYKRYKCKYCGRHFWSKVPRDYCDEPECREKAGLLPYGFIGNPASKKKYTYTEAWNKAWVPIFKDFGHTPIKRYPVVARWRDDVYFVQASIYDFQPHVVSGEVDPPANPLIVPQFCLRFNDVDNVGLSGRHYTGFVMVGEHVFNRPNKFVYFKEKGIRYIHDFLNKIGIKDDDIIFHEDGWAGGGNFGVSIEYFSQGLEIGNQVYMQYEMTPNGPRELKTKVIDMGAGLERTPWILNGTPTSYDLVFPNTLKYIIKSTGFKKEGDIWKIFPQYAAILNADEMNLEESWNEISKKTGFEKSFLKNHIYTMRDIYAVADHFRTLMVGINDGALPSNSGGGYNLRYILRRALSLSKDWNIDIHKIIDEEIKDINDLYPEIKEMKDVINDVIDVEKERYNETKKKSKKIVLKYIKKNMTTENFVKLYESYGISPEIIVGEAEKNGIKLSIPDDFYSKLNERKEISKRKKKNKLNIDVDGIPKTIDVYHSEKTEDEAKVIKIIGDWIVLDKTIFYPESGGQEHDTGKINNSNVTDVQKIKGVILHKVNKVNFSVGNTVKCKIDLDRRRQLTIHHTATHIINAAARKVLGKHVWQHGAHKSQEKAHLDITHYKTLTEEESKKIEKIANDIVSKGYEVKTEELTRTEAEKRYSVRIYQGGAVPGKILRIVSIDDIDHEACGGTHVKNTKDVGKIIILKTERIQDGIIRIEFVAGPAAEKYDEKMKKLIDGISKELNCSRENLLDCVKKFKEEYEMKIKHARKNLKKNISNVSKEFEKRAVKIKLGELIVEYEENNLDIQEIGKTLQKEGRIVIILSGKERIKIFGISKTKLDMGNLVKDVCQTFGGKGGGNKNSAQGFLFGTPQKIIEYIKSKIGD